MVIVNETLARRFWPGEDPLGKRIKLGRGESSQAPWLTVVGVAGDVKSVQPCGKRPVPESYSPYLQETDDNLAESITNEFRSLKIVLRTSGEPRVHRIHGARPGQIARSLFCP